MPMYKKSMIMLLVVVIAVIGGTMYGYSTSDDIKKLDAATSSTIRATKLELKEQKIFVYVTGAVNKPGMVELLGNENELRAADAVNACGGLLPTADVDNFNMAQTIVDGQHIRVPEKIVAQTENIENNSVVQNKSSGSKKNTESSGGIVDINNADADELDTLPGIGPAMAQRIIDYRNTHGSFKSIEEIQNVRGIGAKKFENLKNRIKI